jgi:hypothetical protein
LPACLPIELRPLLPLWEHLRSLQSPFPPMAPVQEGLERILRTTHVLFIIIHSHSPTLLGGCCDPVHNRSLGVSCPTFSTSLFPLEARAKCENDSSNRGRCAYISSHRAIGKVGDQRDSRICLMQVHIRPILSDLSNAGLRNSVVNHMVASPETITVRLL